MAGKLSAAFVRTATEAGKYGDGRGLMLLVHPSGRKQFVQRISIQGKRRDLGLGAFPEVSLAEARDRADENRLIARKGLDPTVEPARTPTFAEAAEEVIKLHSPSWTERGKSASQWSSSLETYAIPSPRAEKRGRDHHGGRDGRPGADLEHEACNRAACAATDQHDHEVGNRERPQARQSGGGRACGCAAEERRAEGPPSGDSPCGRA